MTIYYFRIELGDDRKRDPFTHVIHLCDFRLYAPIRFRTIAHLAVLQFEQSSHRASLCDR